MVAAETHAYTVERFIFIANWGIVVKLGVPEALGDHLDGLTLKGAKHDLNREFVSWNI